MADVPLDPAPIQHPIAERSTFLTTLPWALWFEKLTGAGGLNAPSFGIIAVTNLDNVEATEPTDTLTIIAGNNVTLETNGVAKSLTINSTGGGPAPPNKSVQFNDFDEFGGNAAFLFDKDTTSVSIGLEHDFGTTGAANLLVGSGHTVI
jgi:hypothetical protein